MSAAGKALRSQVSRAWSCATVLMLAATLFVLQASNVRAAAFNFYDFTFAATSNGVGSTVVGGITGGVVKQNSTTLKITSISGNFYGMSSGGLANGAFNYTFANYDPSLGGGTVSSLDFSSSSNYAIMYAQAGVSSKFIRLNSDSSMPYVFNSGSCPGTIQTCRFIGTSVVTLRGAAVAAPEIDGSVVPRAAFVMMGLFWIFKSRQRRLRLAEA